MEIEGSENGADDAGSNEKMFSEDFSDDYVER